MSQSPPARTAATVMFTGNASPLSGGPRSSASPNNAAGAMSSSQDRRFVKELKMQLDPLAKHLIPALSASSLPSAHPQQIVTEYFYSGSIARVPCGPAATSQLTSSSAATTTMTVTRPALFCFTTAQNGVWVPDGDGCMEVIQYDAATVNATATSSSSPNNNAAAGSSSSSPRGVSVASPLTPSQSSGSFLLDHNRHTFPLLLVITFTGEFLDGKRHGTGVLTVSRPQQRYVWSMTCEWANNVPTLDRFPCRLSVPLSSGTTTPSSSPPGSFASDPTTSWSPNASFSSSSYQLMNEYVGMLSMLSDGKVSAKADFEGFAWVLRVRFVPDGTGEMLYGDRRRYCGEWQCGQRHGFGMEMDASGQSTFVGGFQYDAREGSGILIRPGVQMSVSGVWNDGQLVSGSSSSGAPGAGTGGGTASIHLPRRGAVLQATGWSAVPHTGGLVCDADHVVVSPSRAVDGIWEPLFVSFDGILSNAFSDFLLAPTTTHSQQRSREAVPPIPDRGPDGAQALLTLLRKAFQKDEFVAMLSTFQRCMYFFHGCCLTPLGGPNAVDAPFSLSTIPCRLNSRFGDSAEGAEAYLLPGGWPYGTQQKRSIGSALSWCSLMGLGACGCLHRQSLKPGHGGGVRERSFTLASLRQALTHVSSFVFSLRLRLLSLVAAVPAACDLNPGRDILELCWDVAFGYVEPLIHGIASLVTKPNHATFCLAQQRTMEIPLSAFLRRLDFHEQQEEGGETSGEKYPNPPIYQVLAAALSEQLGFPAEPGWDPRTTTTNADPPLSPMTGESTAAHATRSSASWGDDAASLGGGANTSSSRSLGVGEPEEGEAEHSAAAQQRLEMRKSRSELRYVMERLEHVLFDAEGLSSSSSKSPILHACVNRSNSGPFVTFSYVAHPPAVVTDASSDSPMKGQTIPSTSGGGGARDPFLPSSPSTSRGGILPALHSSTSCLIQPSSTVRYLLQFLKRLRRLIVHTASSVEEEQQFTPAINVMQLEEQLLSFLFLRRGSSRNVEAKLLVLSLLLADDAVDPRLPGSLTSLGLADMGFLLQQQQQQQQQANDSISGPRTTSPVLDPSPPASLRDVDVVQDPEIDARASLASVQQVLFLLGVLRRSASIHVLSRCGSHPLQDRPFLFANPLAKEQQSWPATALPPPLVVFEDSLISICEFLLTGLPFVLSEQATLAAVSGGGAAAEGRSTQNSSIMMPSEITTRAFLLSHRQLSAELDDIRRRAQSHRHASSAVRDEGVPFTSADSTAPPSAAAPLSVGTSMIAEPVVWVLECIRHALQHATVYSIQRIEGHTNRPNVAAPQQQQQISSLGSFTVSKSAPSSTSRRSVVISEPQQGGRSERSPTSTTNAIPYVAAAASVSDVQELSLSYRRLLKGPLSYTNKPGAVLTVGQARDVQQTIAPLQSLLQCFGMSVSFQPRPLPGVEVVTTSRPPTSRDVVVDSLVLSITFHSSNGTASLTMAEHHQHHQEAGAFRPPSVRIPTVVSRQGLLKRLRKEWELRTSRLYGCSVTGLPVATKVSIAYV